MSLDFELWVKYSSSKGDHNSSVSFEVFHLLTTLDIIYNEIKWIKEEQMNLFKEKTHKNVYVNQSFVSSSETTKWNYFF